MHNLFKREPHYMWATFFLICCHVLYMTYFFPRYWADTPPAQGLINGVASLVPALKALQQHVPTYTNYWGLFNAIFWIMAPFYWALGFAGSFFLSPFRYAELVVKLPMWRLWLNFVIFFLLVLCGFIVPMQQVSGGLNQMSSFIPWLIFSWFVSAGVIYGQGRIAGAIIIKSKLSRNLNDTN
ncbi:MAG: hypothetical protein P4L92_21375 [Rudaea sp.]|nr:hypothetical protein [Rudaea sp.]